MTSMGFQALAGRIPGERIGTVIHTSSSVGAVTNTETEVASITAALVSGRTYRVTVDYPVRFTVATDMFDARIREDDSSGTQIQRRTPTISVGSGSNTLVRLEVEYTAQSTGNKTFSFTIARQTGTGTGTPVPSAAAPGYMYVDYIRG